MRIPKSEFLNLFISPEFQIEITLMAHAKRLVASPSKVQARNQQLLGTRLMHEIQDWRMEYGAVGKEAGGWFTMLLFNSDDDNNIGRLEEAVIAWQVFEPYQNPICA